MPSQISNISHYGAYRPQRRQASGSTLLQHMHDCCDRPGYPDTSCLAVATARSIGSGSGRSLSLWSDAALPELKLVYSGLRDTWSGLVLVPLVRMHVHNSLSQLWSGRRIARRHG